MFIKFNEEAQKILKNSKIEMQKLKHAFIGSEHVLLSILNSSNNISDKLNELGINYDVFQKELIRLVGVGNSKNDYFIYTPLLKRILENAIIDTKECNNNEVTIESIFLSILDEGEGIAVRILCNLGIDIDNMYEELNKKSYLKKGNKKLIINECSTDLTKKAMDGKIDPLIGRDQEVEEIIEILLRRNKNNPLLIGEAGVGKTAIVEELANRIVNDKVPNKLRNAKIYNLSMASCVAGTKYRGEFEERINKMLKELENNEDIIVFIDEIHTLVGAGGAEGAIDASNIIKPALARGTIKLIGATTINEYKETICKDKALNRRFQTIFIKENTLDETKTILNNLKPLYEEYHGVEISDEIINSIVSLTDKYIGDKNNPDKSLDILDTVCTKVSLNKNSEMIRISELKEELGNIKKKKNELIMKHSFNEAFKLKDNEMKLEDKINNLSLNMKSNTKKIVTINDVANVIESKTKIPVYEINKDTKKLLNLEKYLKKKVIGQDEVIKDIAKITKKMMLGYKNDLPYSFLFTGRSGVGKTLLVKEYSDYLKIPLIRLDMSEYKESHTVSKIIGSPPGYIGYNDTDNVLEKVNNNPFCILLLDEIEKACNEVINLFLQILDEGVITNSHGNKVSFRNTIIIMTSNIGSEKDNIGFNNKKNDIEIRNILSIPLVNRINKVFNFNNLNEDVLRKILACKVKVIKEKYQKNNISICISKKVIDEIISKSEYEVYGARHASKLLEEKIDDFVIEGILNGKDKVYIKV